MMSGKGFRSYQAMNMVHRTKDGNELWLGDYTAASNVSLLRSKNIKNVLTSAAMLDVSYTKQHDINHKIIHAFDIPTYKMAQHFEEGFRFIDQSLKRGNILVHCAAGISRSTTLVLVYLMRAHHMSFQHALGYVRSKRAVVCPNYGFQNELKKYELQLRKDNPVFKQFKEQQTTTLDYNTFKDKKTVFDFMGDYKKRPLGAQYTSLNQPFHYKTTKGYGSSTISSGSHGLRGKSMNYGNRQHLQANQYLSNINKMARGLMSYKMEIPRMVSMKK